MLPVVLSLVLLVMGLQQQGLKMPLLSPVSSSSSVYTASLPSDESLPSFSNWDLVISCIMRPILFPKLDKETLESRTERLEREFGALRTQLKDPEGNLLDGIFIPSNSSSKKAILFCPGADGHYEDNWSYEFIRFIKSQVGDVNILMMNYPGVQKSEGMIHPVKMSFTVFTAFSYLTDVHKFACEDIVVFSQSMGGMAAARALRLLQLKFPNDPIHLVSERSFDAFVPVVTKLLPIPGLNLLAGYSMSHTGWDQKKLASSFLSGKGHRVVIFCRTDGFIDYKNSIADCLASQAEKRSSTVTLIELEETLPNAHFRPFTENENATIARELKSILKI